jgi:site-specific DNA-methyltransferase (adenine-specific)
LIDLIYGDCLEKMQDIESGSVDMVLTDPPYGTTACKWDSIIPLEPMWEQLKRIVKPNGAIVMTASQPFTTTLIASNMKMFKYCWVWEKSHATGFLNAWKMPLKATEDVCVFYGRPPIYNPQLTDKSKRNQRPVTVRTKLSECYGKYDLNIRKCPPDKSMPTTIQRFNNAQGTVHPTQKPVALMEYLIKTYTNEGETVLDFTMGSGTTGVACKNLNRSFIGIEMDDKYFEIAKNRIESA